MSGSKKGMGRHGICPRWARAAASSLLRVPSVIVHEESNVLINPRHPDIAAIKVRKVCRWIYDPRIVRSM
ncbi:MAG: RES family NAD+ phosphorylase [Novosphingobium sp.]